MYQLFWLLGNIMTMPAYLMTCLGTPCEKKYSFKYAQNYFSDSSLALIERASKIRQEWENNDGYKYVLNKVPKWVQPVLKSNYLESAYDLFDETIKISINNTKKH